MRASDWCRLLGRRPCRGHIAAKAAVALSDTARQLNVWDLPRSCASPRPSQREPRVPDTSHREVGDGRRDQTG
jgi:hypothetical protein